MLARFRTITARTAHFTSRPRALPHARTCYAAIGKFTNLGRVGIPVTKDVSIMIGDPGEAYVLVPTEVGYALKTGIYHSNTPSAFLKRPDRLALRYFHDTQSFALESSPICPRLVVPTQLPSQTTVNTSPATLYLYGVMHTIALDGTSDAAFAEIASTIIPEIEDVLDRLKDK